MLNGHSPLPARFHVSKCVFTVKTTSMLRTACQCGQPSRRSTAVAGLPLRLPACHYCCRRVVTVKNVSLLAQKRIHAVLNVSLLYHQRNDTVSNVKQRRQTSNNVSRRR